MREQLAGDEIDPKNPDVLVATSYLRNPIYEYNQRDARGQYEVILTDMTDNAGEVFLGLSFGCARATTTSSIPSCKRITTGCARSSRRCAGAMT